MKVVNRSGIPESLFTYLSQDNYDYEAKGDSYSATEILNPAKAVVLKRRHWSDIEIDAVDQIWKVFGSGVHSILEHEKGIEKIERLSYSVLGRTVSGKWDRIKNNKITDYKVTSAWTLVFGSRVEEWRQQLSIYRMLYYKNKGVMLDDTGSIVAILRDWSQKELRNPKYPKIPAVEIEIKLMSIEETEKFVIDRILAIIDAENCEDEKLPKCTAEERWHSKEKGSVRCAKYCEASKFCSQYKKEIAKKEII